MKGKLIGIGVGVGDPELLTLKALKKLKELDVLIFPQAKKGEGSTAFDIVKEYIREDIEKLYLEFPMIKDTKKKMDIRKGNAKLIAEEMDRGKTIGFLTIGDPMTYSTYSYVLEHLRDDYSVETIPGVTSFASIASTLNIPLVLGNESLKIVSLNKDTDIEKEIDDSDNLVFMKISRRFQELREIINRSGKGNKVVLVSNCGKDSEKIYYNLDEVREVPYFSTLILKKGGLYE